MTLVLPNGATPPPAPGPRRRPRVRAVTAAGRKLNLTDRRPGQRVLPRPERWQDDVWGYADTVPEVKFIQRFYGNALSRIRLVPAVVVDADEAPVPVDVAMRTEDKGGLGLPETVAQLAIDITQRLSNSPDGMPGIMRGFGECLGLVGDSYLVGRDAVEGDPVDEGAEVWQVYSRDAISEGDDGTVMVKETPGATPMPLAGEPTIYRVWRRHARWPGLADSNMSACLDECEELVIYSRMLRAIGRSGTSAGLLTLPSELDHVPENQRLLPGASPVAADPADQSPDDWTPLEQTIMRQFTEAGVPGDQASVAPALIRGTIEALAAIRFLFPERPIDDKVLERIDALIVRIAHGADLPVEVVTGVAEANHWTGWQIEDSTYKAHVEPTAQIPATALAGCYLRPTMAEEGGAQVAEWLPRMAYLLDPSDLVVRPNRTSDARELWDRYAISDEALRDAHAYAEGSEPSEDEVLMRYALLRGVGGPDLTTSIMNRVVAEDDPLPMPTPGEDGPSGDGVAPGDDDGASPEDGGDPIPDGPAARALVAAGTRQLPELGPALAAIERGLRERLQTEASAQLEAALRRAGARLRGAVQGQPEAADVNGQAPETVGLLIGAERAAQLVDVDQLLAGAFDGMRPRWDTWVAAAEAEGVALANQVAGDDGVSVEVTDAGDVERGWAALAAGLLALAGRRLFAAEDAGPGEVDALSAVPAGVIRDALAVAGGSSPSLVPIGSANQSGPASLLFGPRWTRALAALDVERQAWRWAAGFPTTPFEPHQRLSGTVFTTWDDPALANGTSWPRTGHFYPGDHLGCQCDAIAVLVQRT